MDSLRDGWNRCKESLQRQIGEDDAQAWLGSLELAELGPRGAVFSGIPNAFFQHRIRSGFGPLLMRSLAEVFPDTPISDDFRLELRVGGAPESTNSTLGSADAVDHQSGTALPGRPSAPSPPLASRREPSLATTVEGEANRLVLDFARQAAAHPGGRFNPLVIAGGVGTGKSHMLKAIAAALRERSPASRVIYTTAEAFANEVLQGIRGKSMRAVRERFRAADALLVDDAQFLRVSERSQEELLRTFDAVMEGGGQLVFSADRFPSAMTTLLPGLKSRLEGGLVAELGLPDLDMRRRFIALRVTREGLRLDEGHVALLAERITGGFRRLEGAVVGVAAHAFSLGTPVTTPFIEQTAGPYFDPPAVVQRVPVAPARVLDAVCGHFRLSRKALCSRSRNRLLVEARAMAAHLLREASALSYAEIGEQLGKRGHATIHLGETKLRARLAEDPHLARVVATLREVVTEDGAPTL